MHQVGCAPLHFKSTEFSESTSESADGNATNKEEKVEFKKRFFFYFISDMCTHNIYKYNIDCTGLVKLLPPVDEIRYSSRRM